MTESDVEFINLESNSLPFSRDSLADLFSLSFSGKGGQKMNRERLPICIKLTELYHISLPGDLVVDVLLRPL